MDIIKELWQFIKVRKKYWLLPILFILFLFGTFLVVGQGTAIAPFIYTIFQTKIVNTKKKFFVSLYVLFILILTDVLANLVKIRPLLWKSSFYSYLNVGWYNWHGADHLFEKKEIHIKQTNGFQTRGLKPNKKLSKNIILLEE